MPGAAALYGRYVAASVRGQMQYKLSFWMSAGGMFLATVVEFAAIALLFRRFGSLRGWSLPEVAMLYGVINVGYSLTEAAARGFDHFADLVKSGDFDRILLRPRSTALQVAGQELQMMRVGRLAQGAAVLAWALAALHVAWTPAKALLLVAAVLGAAALFYGLFILQATLAFWTVETLEIMNTLTYGGTETAQYPMTIYRPWFRGLFLFVVPVACVNYLPATAILGRPNGLGLPSLFAWFAPLVGFVFLAASLQAWKLGVRHYHSTGS